MLQAVLDGADNGEHEVELVFFEPGSWPDELARRGLRVEVVHAGRLRQAHRWLATVVRLARILRARRPDLVLNWSAKTQLYGAPAALLAGMADRNLWWQQAIPNRNWLDLIATLLPARAIACYSQAAADAQHRLRPRRDTFVIGAGSPAPAQASDERVPLELPQGTTVVGLVGRLQPWKGQDRLLQAQALLRKRGHEIHTLIVGGDSYGLSPRYAQSLRGLVERLGLTGAVTMTGEVADAGPYIRRMDVLVNASDPEPFGIVLLEAMARGVAVAAVNSGGPSEFIEDRRSGVLARSGEPAALADALEPLIASPSLRAELARAGRERYLREFTDVAMRERFFAALTQLVPAARGPAGGRAGPGAGAAARARSAVTIVAHDVGGVGGMERVLSELIEGLRDRGEDVTVIARSCELRSMAGIRFHRVRGPGRPFVFAYPWFLLTGSLVVRRRRRGLLQSTGAIVLNRAEVIAVHYVHQVGPAYPSRAGLPFRAQMRLVGILKRNVERICFAINSAATFVCVSEGVAAELAEHYPQLAQRVLTIHNGVDLTTFAPGARERDARAARSELQIPENLLVALFVGGEWERKGLRAALEALTGAREWVLVVAGDGDRARFQSLADSLGVGARVRWLGLTEDVQLAYALADAFVLPSSYETFSLVTFEAAASGLPLLCAEVSGVRELITDGENGFFITAQGQDIAARLSQLGADSALRARLGEAARASALAFSWQAMVQAHRQLYARLRGQPASCGESP